MTVSETRPGGGRSDADRKRYPLESRPETLHRRLTGEVTAFAQRDENGLLWIEEERLRADGFDDLADFDRVVVDGRVFELQGFRASTREWWVEDAGPAAA